jgi:hypothetical protein
MIIIMSISNTILYNSPRIFTNVNTKVWYGCYREENTMNCYGPFNTFINTELFLKYKLQNNFNIIPSTIHTTCRYMPDFMTKYKLNNKIFVDKNNIIPIKLN